MHIENIEKVEYVGFAHQTRKVFENLAGFSMDLIHSQFFYVNYVFMWLINFRISYIFVSFQKFQ